MNAQTQPFDPKLDLVLERVIDVPRELVWKAWTEAEHLKQWFCPKPWRTTECALDLRPGGTFGTVMEGPNGERHAGEGCYLEVVPNQRLVWTSALKGGYRPNLLPKDMSGAFLFTASLTLEPEGNGTRYKALVQHADEAGREAHEAMGFAQGWGTALDQLVEMVKSW